jgi:hypothetical protein
MFPAVKMGKMAGCHRDWWLVFFLQYFFWKKPLKPAGGFNLVQTGAGCHRL